MRFLLFNIAVTCALLYLAGLAGAPAPWSDGDAGSPAPGERPAAAGPASALVAGPRLVPGLPPPPEASTALSLDLGTSLSAGPADNDRPAIADATAAPEGPLPPARPHAAPSEAPQRTPDSSAERPERPAAANDTGGRPPTAAAESASPPPEPAVPARSPEGLPPGPVVAELAPEPRPVVAAPEIERMMLPTDDPEVRRRRAEVLGLAPQPAPEQRNADGAASVTRPGGADHQMTPSVRQLLAATATPSMTPAERRASLLDLAERMETAAFPGAAR